MIGLPGSEESLKICQAVLTQYHDVTDGRTDGRTGHSSIVLCTGCADAR